MLRSWSQPPQPVQHPLEQHRIRLTLVTQGMNGGLLGFRFVARDGGRVVEDTNEGQWRRRGLGGKRRVSRVVVLTEGAQYDGLLDRWSGRGAAPRGPGRLPGGVGNLRI
jgi:hypothetical protein